MNRFKIAIILSTFLNLILIGALLYLFSFTTQGIYLFRKATLYPRTVNWEEEVMKYEKLNRKTMPIQIVMLGNSITYECQWYELLNRADVVNRGIPGELIEGVQQRIPTIFALKSHTIVLMLGINNLLHNEDAYNVFKKYKALADTLITQVQLLVCSTLYTVNHKEINLQVALLNQMLEHYCKKKHIPWIDLNQQLSANQSLKQHFSYDGIHLTAEAYSLWKEMLLPYLPPVNHE
ncbi:MAG: GDSL-type esterase/lipase family protein [Breznakibacter sp.]